MKSIFSRRGTILSIAIIVAVVASGLYLYKTIPNIPNPAQSARNVDTSFGSTSLSIAPLEARTYGNPDFKFVLPTIDRNIVKCEDYNSRYSHELNTRCWQDLATLKNDTAATDSKDLSVCDKFESDNTTRTLCYQKIALIEKDPGICEISSTNSSDKDDCYSRMAYLSDIDSSSVCNRISNPDIRNTCLKDNNISNIARANHADECNKYSATDKKECMTEVAAIQSNPSLCNRIEGDNFAVEQCIYRSDAAMKDSSYCGLVKADKTYQPDNRDTCYFDFATINQKPGECNNISSPRLLDKCLWMTSLDIYRTYTNKRHGYSLKYDWSTNISEIDSGKDSSSCVSMKNGFGYILIRTAGGDDPCSRTGVGVGDELESEDVYVMGNKYTATGFVSPNKDYSQLSFGVGRILVLFGIDTGGSVDSLTDYWYQSTLDGIKKILSTLDISQSSNKVDASQNATTTNYINKEYGFEFSYPSSWTMKNGDFKEGFSLKFGPQDGPIEGVTAQIHYTKSIDGYNNIGSIQELKTVLQKKYNDNSLKYEIKSVGGFDVVIVSGLPGYADVGNEAFILLDKGILNVYPAGWIANVKKI
ncbi:MAG: PsbP-related protein [Candidatus Taylorbacteria bacterium]